jgi:hypothetical protein
MAENKDIKYINKDFGEFKTSLIEFAKTYFPSTYNDFSNASPGGMFLEMSAYIGDVLSFYLDNQIQENFLQYTRQQNNIYSLAYMMGYRPKATGVATTSVEITQEVPSINIGGTYVPDINYALYFTENTILSSNSTNTANANFDFLIQDDIDFSYSSSSDPTEITVASYDSITLSPSYFQLKKRRTAISATINTTTFTFGTVTKFPTVEIEASNIIGILDIVDDDGNTWYEVPYLAQETIFDSIKNTNVNNPDFSLDSDDVPYLLQLRKEPRRFVTRLLSPTQIQIQFGAGTNTANTDEEIIPNPDNVGLGLPYKQSKLNTAFSPSNFLYTDTYGIAPANTTLTVRYLTGGGVTSNIPSNTLNLISSNNYRFTVTTGLNSNTANTVFNSVAANNPSAATGGQDGDTTDEIRLNALGSFPTQLRSVTADDYLIRALSLPSNYGAIAKIFIQPEKISDLLPVQTPSVLDLYVLAYDVNKNLKTASSALKQNLSTYLSQYRTINDSLKIKDAFVINIGVDFEIIVLPQYNNNLVLTNCITALQDYFNVDKWQINEPILLKDLFILVDNIDGVQTVKNINITNKTGISLGYSQYAYDIPGATQNNVIYPSLDPMIFEVKYPNTDIRGKVVSY